MSRIQNTPKAMLRIYGCTYVGQPFKFKPFAKMSAATIILAQSIISASSIDEIYEIVKAVAEEPSIKKHYDEMSQNIGAVWFAEEAFVNAWGWWVGNSEAKGSYKPQKHNRKHLTQIQGNVEKFLKFAMEKYWSVLGSESKKPFGQCYFVDHDVLIERYAHIDGDHDSLEDEVEEDESFDRSMVRIVSIHRKKKYIQLGFNF